MSGLLVGIFAFLGFLFLIALERLWDKRKKMER